MIIAVMIVYPIKVPQTTRGCEENSGFAVITQITTQTKQNPWNIIIIYFNFELLQKYLLKI